MTVHFEIRKSWQAARQLLEHPPHGRFPLCREVWHSFILRELHRGDRLIFARPAGDLALNGVSCVNEQLSQASEARPGFPRVSRKGTVAGHENIGIEGLDRSEERRVGKE